MTQILLSGQMKRSLNVIVISLMGQQKKEWDKNKPID